MANPAAEAHARVLAAHPEAVVVERGRYHIKHRLADGPDGRPRYVLDSWLPPIAGGAGDPACNDQTDDAFDDGWEKESDGEITVENIYIQARANASSANRYWAAMRFHTPTGVDPAPDAWPANGSTITAAYVEVLTISETYDDVACDIYAEDGADPATLTTDAGDITDRVRTSESAEWVADSLGIGWKQSPSLVDVVQELVTDYTVAAIVLIFNPRTNVDKHLYFYAWDQTGNVSGAKLHLEWTEGAAPQTLTPSPVTVPLVIPAPTLALTLTLSPTPVATTLAVPAPTLLLTLTLAPDPVTIPLAVPAPTLGHALALIPDPVTIPLAIPSPTLALSLTLVPDPIAVPLVFPAPTILIGGILLPDPVQIALAIPAPTLVLTKTLTPDPVAVALAIPAPVVTKTLVLTPDPATIPLALPAPTLALTLSLQPSPVAILLVIPSPTIVTGLVYAQFGKIIAAIDPDDYPTGTTLKLLVVIWTSDAAKTVYARLYNVTDGVTETESVVNTNSTSPVEALSSALSLPSGDKTYRIEVGGIAGGTYYCAKAVVRGTV